MSTHETHAVALASKAASLARGLDHAAKVQRLGAEFDRLARARRAADHAACIRRTGAALDRLQRGRAAAAALGSTAL